MKAQLLQALSLLLLPSVHGAPASRSNEGNPPLRGSQSLIGYSESNTITEKSTEGIKYTLVPGQKDDADDGIYFDFETADNPQPIRGSTGGTDPGPSMSTCPDGWMDADADRK